MILFQRFTAFLLMYLCTIPCFAADLPDTRSVSGEWYSHTDQAPKTNWTAAWIWPREKGDNQLALFRKSFTLQTRPEKAQVKITATSRYKLYINGKYVNRGPARSAPHHQSYDIINIGPLLIQGRNNIAVQVHALKGLGSYNHVGRGGLMAQIEVKTKDSTIIISSDQTWKSNFDPSWTGPEHKISRFHQQVNDTVDMRKAIAGWQLQDFNDNNWPNSNELMRNSGWPKVQKNAKATAMTPPWTRLVPRSIPYLSEEYLPATNLISAYQIDDYFFSPNAKKRKKFISLQNHTNISAMPKGVIQIPASQNNQPWLLVFDMGKVINGLPVVDITGSRGTRVEVISMPFMVNNKFSAHSVDADHIDRITLSGNRDKWQAQYFKPTRYLGIVIDTSGGAANINNIGLHQLAYPFQDKGMITSRSEPWIKEYIQASKATIRTATTDAFTDNYRERRQYAQTGYYAALGNYYTFGDTALQKRYLVQVAQEQQAGGLMPAYAPLMTNDYMVILDSNCLWIRSLHNYLLYSGDEKTVRSLMPAAQKLMDLLESFTAENGLINNPPYAYWLDHAVNDRRGMNLTLNGHYIGALQDYAAILNWLKLDKAEKYTAQAQTAKSFIQQNFWQAKKGLFVDALIGSKKSNIFSEHGNAMAMALTIATPIQAKAITSQLLTNDGHNFIKRANGTTMVTPAMSYFLHKGMADYGYIDQSMQMFKQRFDQMLAANTNGTLWEEWWRDATGRTGELLRSGRTRSDAQTESAFPPVLFAEYLLGVKPGSPGMTTMQISRMHHGLKDIKGVIPTPHGNLSVSWEFNTQGGGILELDIPAGMTVQMNKASFRTKAFIRAKYSAGTHVIRF